MCQMNVIELEFDKMDTGLAGNAYGRSIYEEQVKSKFVAGQKNVIRFPENIEQVASSFVQGFFAELVKEMGYEKVREQIIIDSPYDYVKEGILKDLVL